MTMKRTCCFCLALLLPATVHVAQAVGGFFGVGNATETLQNGQSIAFGVEGNDVTVVYQIRYGGDHPGETVYDLEPREFSWVIPVPNRPTKVDVGSELLFQALHKGTKPEFVLDVRRGPNAASFGDTLPCGSRVEYTPEWCNDGDPRIPQFSASSSRNSPLVETAGPYEYVILEGGPNADPTQVLRYLRINGYTRSEGADALLNFYAKQGYAFIVLRLRGRDVGEIQPLVVTYPQNEEPEMGISISLRKPAATIPFQMASTSIATDWQFQPIHVYALGTARAVPLNFLEVELDDAQADWLETGACFIQQTPLGSSDVDDCFFKDYLDRFEEATMELANHSFVTEYAGSSDFVANQLFINLTANEIENAASWEEFSGCCRHRLPDTELVETILSRFGYDSRFNDDPPEWNATGLAWEIDDRVLQPAIQAQAWVDQFPYLTRMFARLSTETLSKDAFFTFNSALPPVDNVHQATAVAHCGDNGTVVIVVPDDQSTDGNPACGSGLELGLLLNEVQDPKKSKAIKVTAWGFEIDAPVEVYRLLDGTFDYDEVAVAISYGDSLVPDQTIPEYLSQEPELLEEAARPLAQHQEQLDAAISKSSASDGFNVKKNSPSEPILATSSTPHPLCLCSVFVAVVACLVANL